LLEGALVAWLGRKGRALSLFLPDDPPARVRALDAIAHGLAAAVDAGRLEPFTLEEVDAAAAARSPLAPALVRAGFTPSAAGYVRRRIGRLAGASAETGGDDA